MAFKVGDKVKIMSVTSHPELLSAPSSDVIRLKYKTIGETGVICRCDSDKIYGVTRNMENQQKYENSNDYLNRDSYFCYFEQDLELIKEEESKMKFKIGDKVKTARKCGSGGGWFYNGSMPLMEVGEVVRIDDPESYIAVDIVNYGRNGFHPNELDLIPDEPKVSEVVPFLKSIEEVQSFVKESKDQLSKLEGNKNVTDGILQAHRDQLSIINRHLESLVKSPTTSSIFDSLNSPEEAVSFLVSEWVKCTNPKVKTELSQFNTMQNPNVSGVEFRFPKR